MAMPSKRRAATIPINDLHDDFSIHSEQWMASSACGELDAAHDLFFPDTKQQELQAKDICARCPVAWQCLDLALRNTELWGIWGGMTFAERCDFTTQYRDHTGSAARAAHRRHLTELNGNETSHVGRAKRLRP